MSFPAASCAVLEPRCLDSCCSVVTSKYCYFEISGSAFPGSSRVRVFLFLAPLPVSRSASRPLLSLTSALPPAGSTAQRLGAATFCTFRLAPGRLRFPARLRLPLQRLSWSSSWWLRRARGAAGWNAPCFAVCLAPLPVSRSASRPLLSFTSAVPPAGSTAQRLGAATFCTFRRATSIFALSSGMFPVVRSPL